MNTAIPDTARRAIARLLPRVALLILLAMISLDASAQVRAWLDRDRIAMGETVTLNIESTAATTASEPDYAPLLTDFFVSGRTSRREFLMNNGRSTIRTLYAVALRPRRDGVITIPALNVGSLRTQPIPITVAPAAAPSATRTEDVFIESEADDPDPYVQQSVGWVVRLYSATPLISGQLDQDAPEGASLQRVGDDAQYQRDIGGRRYHIVERRFLLVPERSGVLTIPPARFEGRGAGGFFDDLLGGRGGALEAQGTPRKLDVQAAPANAPQPWLPLQNLTLRYQSNPQELRVGSAATVTVEALADGAMAAQMPELQLPPIDGVQVFAEPVQADERFVDGRPRVKLTRRFSLVPAREGNVQLAGMQMRWWNVRDGSAQTTALPPLSWTVLPGTSTASTNGTPAPNAAPSSGVDIAARAPVSSFADLGGANRIWVLAALLFAALWLFTLVWGLHRSDAAKVAAVPRADEPPSPGQHIDLKRLIDRGDLGDVADALCALARPPARDLDTVRARLADPRQREALDVLQHARWGGGSAVTAREHLRQAFAQGPKWHAQAATEPSPLAPLYPPERGRG
ncbi:MULTISPECIES: BatD family protein [unclassified Lysobacter]|uniref:BatD family protein n=1 Tax=unclassified Lysobacter TaxID=2635362 RepID=UPI001C234305|nr:BatD family protein [Lysobacter sp. MMG2]MBU8976819.1 BatD family protein [Lysobacter sp. MMG2]